MIQARDPNDSREEVVMVYLVAVPLESGGSIVMEVDEPAGSGVVRSARPGELIAALDGTFEAALQRLQPVAQAIIERFRNAAESLDEVGVEFGLKMSVEAGMVIAHTGGEANFAVTLRWKRGTSA
jgi:hypothetical protein